MEKLIRGIHTFQDEYFSSQQALFERLARGQSPETLFITCSDSRINPNLLTQTEPGELFILRNAGNLVPPHGALRGGGEAATVEYAVVALGVKDIIVCGHSHCGAMAGLLHPERLGALPAVGEWLNHAEATRRIVRENYADLPEAELVVAAIKENVLVQLDHLRTLPAVAAKLSRGEIKLHAWVYEIESGKVFAYDAADRSFHPLARELQPAVKPVGVAIDV